MPLFPNGNGRRSLGNPIALEEVDALIRHVAEKGLDPNGQWIPDLQAARADWQATPEDTTKYAALLKCYTALTARTRPVSGRVLLDSENSDKHLKWLVYCTFILLLIATTHGVMRLWFQGATQLAGQPMWQALRFSLDFLNPFVWGALGSCVYLLKRLYDIATVQQFDAALFRGWWVRLVLGAVLGGVVVQIFEFTADQTAAGSELSKTAIAFLTGLGVRVVYGAFERTVQVLAEKMNLGTVHNGDDGTGDARTALAQKLAQIDADKDPEKYRALLELMNELSGRSTALTTETKA
ncbi:MAG: hypothetical protein QNJ22_24080 [Desulfosarcinaceae bacterium]|nr:hypothetical protein [Desulfosarcinaceae bacterium]